MSIRLFVTVLTITESSIKTWDALKECKYIVTKRVKAKKTPVGILIK